VQIEWLLPSRNKWKSLVEFDLPIPAKPWSPFASHFIAKDEETAARAERASKDLLERLKGELGDTDSG